MVHAPSSSTAGGPSRQAWAVRRVFRLLACNLGVSIAVVSCGGPVEEGGFRPEKLDSRVSRLLDDDTGLAKVSAFAREDSVCAGTRPDTVAGAAADSGAGSDRDGQGTPQFRDRVRKELRRMEFRTCLRTMSRTVQWDGRLRHDQFTELVAWKGDTQNDEAIFVPVRYRVRERGGAQGSDSSSVWSVAAVLEALHAFWPDSAPTVEGRQRDGTRRKSIVVSVARTEEPDGLSDIPARAETRGAATVWMSPTAGPHFPRMPTPFAGWMVAKLRSSEGRVSPLGLDMRLPVRLPAFNTDPPGGALCESGERCDLIVPSNPALQVHAMFFPETPPVGTAEARRMGERTLEVLLAVDTLAYGEALPVSRAELRALWWWLAPCVLLVCTIWLAFMGLLGPISAAIRIARQARMRARINSVLARGWHLNPRAVLSFRRRCASERDIGEATGKAIAGPKLVYEEVDEALRTWAEEVAAWEKERRRLLGDVRDCRASVVTCVREVDKAGSAEQPPRQRLEGIRPSLEGVRDQLNLARQMERNAGKVLIRAHALGEEARGLADRGNAWAAKVKKGTAAGSKSEAPRTASKVVRRDAKALKAAARELRSAAKCTLQRTVELRYWTACNGLTCLIMCLRAARDKKRDGLATSFNCSVRVLAKFCTDPWSWRVFTCGVAVSAAVVHGFIVKVNDPILNVVLAGVSEDVWALVYVGLATMVFLASALEAKKYTINNWLANSLSYWNGSARRSGTESKRSVSLLARLKHRSQGAVVCYVLLLLLVAVIALNPNAPVLGAGLDALRNSAAPPRNPQFFGDITLDDVILLVLVVFFLPACWIFRYVSQMAEDRS